MKTGKLGLPISSVESGSPSFNNFMAEELSIVRQAIDKIPYVVSLKHSLNRDPRVSALEGKMICNGSGASRFSLENLVMWWVWRANRVGVEVAKKNLEDFLVNEKIDINEVLWIYGAAPEEVLRLTGDVRLVPLKDMPDSREKKQAMDAQFGLFPTSGIGFSAALVASRKVDKIYPSDLVCCEFEKSFFKKFHEISFMLNIIGGICCAAGFQTGYVSDETPFGPFGGSGGSLPVYDVLPKMGTSHVSHESALHFSKLFEKFQNLPSNWKERVLSSSRRLAQAKSRIDLNDKALDLGIALEMVLLHSEHNKAELPGQLSNHFRLRGTWLAGNDYVERKQYFDSLGRIYSQRSQVAHNGILAPLKGPEHNQLHEQIAEHIEVAEIIIQKLIISGPPVSWTNLVLGETLIEN